MARNLLAVRRAWLRPVWCGVAALFLWNTAAAQYLEPGEHRRPDTRFVSAGVLQREFHPLASNILPDSLAIRYDQLMPVIGFRHGVLDILAGYTRYRLRGAKREALIISASASQELLLAGGREHALLLPLIFSSDFAKAETEGPERETFNVASLGVGAGITFRSSGRTHEAWVSVLGIAQYSFEGLGTGSGFSPALTGEAGALLPEALSFVSLAAGYRFRLQTWSMGETKFNYRSLSHGPYVGVVF